MVNFQHQNKHFWNCISISKVHIIFINLTSILQCYRLSFVCMMHKCQEFLGPTCLDSVYLASTSPNNQIIVSTLCSKKICQISVFSFTWQMFYALLNNMKVFWAKESCSSYYNSAFFLFQVSSNFQLLIKSLVKNKQPKNEYSHVRFEVEISPVNNTLHLQT